MNLSVYGGLAAQEAQLAIDLGVAAATVTRHRSHHADTPFWWRASQSWASCWPHEDHKRSLIWRACGALCDAVRALLEPSACRNGRAKIPVTMCRSAPSNAAVRYRFVGRPFGG
jgi:hypothetical protein